MKSTASPASDAAPAPRKRRRASGRPAGDSDAVGRERIVDCACELLRTLPPSRITRSEVARLAEVDPSLARYYFRDGESLLLAVAERLTDIFTRRVATSHAQQTAEAMLRARIGALLALHVDYPYFHQLIAQEVVTSAVPHAQALLLRLTQGGVGAYRAIVDAGIAEGTMRDVDCHHLFMSVIGLCEAFVAAFPMLGVGTDKAPDVAAERARYEAFVCDLVLNGLRVSR